MNQKKINNIFGLPSKERYSYLLKKVADFETIYLIADNENQYVMIGSEDITTIPVWPEKEFAILFLTDDWNNYTVIELSINEFLKLLTDLEKENVDLAGFPNMEFKTIKISANEMKNHLLFELSQYE